MADASRVINVSLLQAGPLAARDNMNVTAIMTSQQTGPISTANRYELYRDSASVATAFGSAAGVTAFAEAYFGTSPNPVNAGGVLVVGFYRAASETVAATAATLTSPQLSEASLIPQLQAIADGSFDITVDATTTNVTALDLRTVTSMDGLATVLSAAITGGTVTHVDQRLIVTSDTTGATSLMTFTTDPATGVYLGVLLGWAAGTGAVTVQGAASDVLALETKSAAIAAVAAEVAIKGFCFVDATSDAESEALASWSQANGVLGYDVFTDPTNLEIDPANPVWTIKLAGQTSYRMLYSAAGNRALAASYMARAHTVNFGAANSALTMHLKTLSVPSEEYDDTTLDKAFAVGLDVYTDVGGTPSVLCSGENGFTDERYNLLGYINAVKIDTFNVLKGTSTKVNQTDPGTQELVDSIEGTTRGFVNAAVFAPGTWTSSDSFGDVETLKRSVESLGYYVLAGLLENQSDADRLARKSTVIQVAVKGAGAIHSADTIINFNV